MSPTWRLALPLAPAVALGVLAMLPIAAAKSVEASTQPPAEIQKQIKTATQKLQERIRESQKKAEELGLHSFWVNDTPMVHGDPFVALSLCAKATSRIRLGIGVTSPALRSAPAAASGLTSLNALAPGRIICGVGTGNTARRTLGMPPTTAAALENFTAAVQDPAAPTPSP